MSKTCRYDTELGYLSASHWPACKDTGCAGCLPCEHDDDGREIRHCLGHRCTNHLADHERLHCGHCVRATTNSLRKIGQLAELLPVLAMEQGRLNSEAMSLAGPAPRPSKVRERRVALMRLIASLPPEVRDRARAALPDEDPHHPYTVLGRWDMMLREDYDEPTILLVTIPRSIAYLVGKTPVMAQDPEQDFPQFATEIRTCLRHLEAVLQIVRRPEKGAPCPVCEAPSKPLIKRYSHWCDDPDCTRQHDVTGARDTWVCQVNPREHWWSDTDYRLWLYDVKRDGIGYTATGVSAS